MPVCYGSRLVLVAYPREIDSSRKGPEERRAPTEVSHASHIPTQPKFAGSSQVEDAVTRSSQWTRRSPCCLLVLIGGEYVAANGLIPVKGVPRAPAPFETPPCCVAAQTLP